MSFYKLQNCALYNAILNKVTQTKHIKGERVKRVEEAGRPATTISRPSHLGILVLRLFCDKKFPILEDKTISSASTIANLRDLK